MIIDITQPLERDRSAFFIWCVFYPPSYAESDEKRFKLWKMRERDRFNTEYFKAADALIEAGVVAHYHTEGMEK